MSNFTHRYLTFFFIISYVFNEKIEISLKCKDVGIEGNSDRGKNSKAILALQTNVHNF
jgi:hypothetical protein